MKNKSLVSQTVFNTLTATIRLAVLVIFALGFQFSPTPALAANELTGQELTIVARTNAVRVEAGLPALTVDNRLMKSAVAKANDMATRGYFDHANPDGYRMAYWINGAGYPYLFAGENLAKGFHSIDRLINAWVASPSHYKNLVEPRFTSIGVGMAEGWYEGQETLFIVQHFGVEAISVAEHVNQLTSPAVAAIAPPTESVAGATEQQATKLSQIYPTPLPTNAPVITQPVVIERPPTNPPAFINDAQASPLAGDIPVPTDSSLQFWPIFALMALALIGYLDEYLPLWTATHPSKA